MHWTDEIEIISNHYEAYLHLNGWVEKIYEAVGKKETKNPAHRARDAFFNKGVAKVWVDRIKKGGTRLNPAFEEAYRQKQKNILNKRYGPLSDYY